MWDASSLASTEPDALGFYDIAGSELIRNSETYYSKKDAGTLGSDRTYFFDRATGEPLLMGNGAAAYVDDYDALDVVSDQLGALAYTSLFLTPDGEILMAYGSTENDYSGQDFSGVTDYYTLENNINAWADAGIAWSVDISAPSWSRLSNPSDTTGAISGAGLDYFGGDATVVCFARDTLITTSSGAVPIQSLAERDLVLIRDHGHQPVRWIGSRRLTVTELGDAPNLYPIRIRKGALGDNIPARDLMVSPQHRVLVRSKIAQKMFGTDEVLIAAKHMLELDGIEIAGDMPEVEYFHILFDRHEVIFSNGAETESLYTGPQALKSLGAVAREEIFTLFPQLRDQEPASAAAVRPLISGRMGRHLAARHSKNQRELIN